MTRICFIAAPLIARSGVYNSTVELVRAGRKAGLEWTAVLGVSTKAGGSPLVEEGIREFAREPSGLGGVRRLSSDLSELPEVAAADLRVSMVPQTDMALSLRSAPWVAYLRGLPWPAPTEASALKTAAWRTLELAALRRAREVWATTPTLADDVGAAVDRLVPPGLVPPRAPSAKASTGDVVWAARFSRDKNPSLFLDALRGTPVQGVMYGSGPLEEQVGAEVPTNVRMGGWRSREEVWASARVYVGTSTREAFGRSAVEAAMLGIPVVMSRAFGCAEMIYTDETLSRQLVLDPADVPAWTAAITRLTADEAFYTAVAAHAQSNAQRLTVESAVDNVRTAAEAVLHR
ncbi:glycosyltransferase family 4 protein [Microbacterium sp. IEGM 1404]|uniref:glycosyltransferase family 4 protein n=1 Tax=Microbacterium sp. IEGM 1404 TaxID=3047084 RepID=UPI0024B79034|nr:glycosyltransferase family 4 protein [Microbacterium sp. IEGM 1404]MDI9891758.1 glycosyltransferase family 4 protein [Microbacterium sp. IEGM 1404]